MPRPLQTVFLVSVLLVVASPHRACEAQSPPSDQPRLVFVDRGALERAKQSIRIGGASLTPAFDKLQREAKRALEFPIDPVTKKTANPPSGDKRDYMSVAPYWWPSPNAPDGLPYVRRDCEVNPDRDRSSDRKRLGAMVRSVKTLSLAYFYSEHRPYADRAARLLRVWFLDAATRMNPHLRYAQAVPGVSQGRGAGIIETHDFVELIDAIALLRASPAWNASAHARAQNWFSEYLDWLTDSPEGKAEAKAPNNHGTWYDVQVASYAFFAGRDPLAQRVLDNFSIERIAKQIEPDGRQSHELARMQSRHYAIFNLEAMFAAAALGDREGIDLWNYRSSDKRSLRGALDWLIPFAAGEKTWSYKQITRRQPEKLAPLLRRAALRYREPAYETALSKMAGLNGDERWRLLYPNVSSPKK